LILNRDKYKNIHLHLENNNGGHIVPAHIIIRCLIGKNEKWMKKIKKIYNNKTIYEWNCWKEEEINSPNYEIVKQLNLVSIPNYTTKYNGKIYVYMNTFNGSATWFLITYLIYGFNNKIIRFNKNSIKYGKNISNKLKLIGMSGTTSGDGNAIDIKYGNIKISCPTEQFISSSIKKQDWNRYWMQN
jgi:hypothetical protein